MLQIIVFSFNRAMQLDTLVSSLIDNWEFPDYKIDIVYNYSSEDFGNGYKLFAEKFADKPVELHQESTDSDKVSFRDYCNLENLVRIYRNQRLKRAKSNFRSLIIKLLEESESKNIMFLTDDSMFISPIAIPDEIITWINNNPTQRQFSLRLGQGVSSLPDNVSVFGEYCEWNMYQNKGNWGYPFSVDAHIYNKAYILELFKKYIFVNPSTLEGNIVGSVKRHKKLSEAKCFVDIKMLTFPINIVQDSVDNVCQDVSIEMLNKRYLCGDTLKYCLDKQFNATKQYVKELEFRNKRGAREIVVIKQEPTNRPNRI